MKPASPNTPRYAPIEAHLFRALREVKLAITAQRITPNDPAWEARLQYLRGFLSGTILEIAPHAIDRLAREQA